MCLLSLWEMPFALTPVAPKSRQFLYRTCWNSIFFLSLLNRFDGQSSGRNWQCMSRNKCMNKTRHETVWPFRAFSFFHYSFWHCHGRVFINELNAVRQSFCLIFYYSMQCQRMASRVQFIGSEFVWLLFCTILVFVYLIE